MRFIAPPFRWFFLLGLLPLWGYSVEPQKPPGDSPPVLISQDGGNPRWSSVEQLRKFAAKGDPQACFELGELTLHGNEVPQDTRRAVQLLEQAAQGGINNAWFRLGKIYHDGLTGPPDYGRTLDYYTRAARAGVPEAQHNIGAMLVSGRGVKRDMIEGLAWLIVATKSGAVSEAEIQVRDRLARRPADIKAAEARAGDLLGNLSAATVNAVLKVAATSTPADASGKVPPAPVVIHPMTKPVITPAAMDPLVPVKIPPPVSPPSLPPANKP